MHRIDTAGAVAGQFSAGNPQAGQLATRLGAEWPNDVQENICHVIEQAGIALAKGDGTQLHAAMIALIAGVIGAGGGAVPTTRTVSGGGLVTGGGALAANLTLSVAAASSAEIIAGLLNTKAITPAGLFAAASAGLAANGYYILPGGLIVQWGQLRGTYSEGSVAVTLPIAFPSAFYNLSITGLNQSANNTRDVFMQMVSRSLSGFVAYFNYDGSGTDSLDGFDFIAMGK